MQSGVNCYVGPTYYCIENSYLYSVVHTTVYSQLITWQARIGAYYKRAKFKQQSLGQPDIFNASIYSASIHGFNAKSANCTLLYQTKHVGPINLGVYVPLITNKKLQNLGLV